MKWSEHKESPTQKCNACEETFALKSHYSLHMSVLEEDSQPTNSESVPANSEMLPAILESM